MFDKHKPTRQGEPETPESAPAPQPPKAAPAPASAGAGNVAMIGPGIRINGDVSADSNLRIEGHIEGRSIESSHDVEISESGKVTASITAKVVKVAGAVNGDIAGSEKVLISRSGRVQGNIVAPRVQLEDGALFRGSIDMTPGDSAAAARSDKQNRSAPETTTRPTVVADQGKAAAAGSARKDAELTLKSG
jgi:cytoskeletal protein CcmA (bactofilin family)